MQNTMLQTIMLQTIVPMLQTIQTIVLLQPLLAHQLLLISREFCHHCHHAVKQILLVLDSGDDVQRNVLTADSHT